MLFFDETTIAGYQYFLLRHSIVEHSGETDFPLTKGSFFIITSEVDDKDFSVMKNDLIKFHLLLQTR